MALFEDPATACFAASSSFSAWLAKIGQTGAQASVLEHNSAAAALALALDSIANPALVASATGAPSGYLWATYNGPNYQGWTMHGLMCPQLGSQPEPTDPTARLWWDATAELARRLGLGWYTFVPANVTAPGQPVDVAFYEVWGVARSMVVPLWTNDGTQGVYTENPDATTVLVTVWPAILAYAARMIAIASGSTDPSVTSSSAAEIAAAPQIQLLADEYRAENTTAREIAGGAVAAALLTTLVGAVAR